MSTPFAAALAAYGLHNCLVNDTTLWIGLDGRTATPNAQPLAAPPGPLRRVVFLEAPVQADLVRALVASPQVQTLDELFIGTAQAYPGRYSREAFPGYDMAQAVGALAGAHLPALRHLVLGDMEDLSGGFRLFGTVGDITPIFAAAPSLTTLGLYGNFALSAPVRHRHLEVVETLFDTYGVTGEVITQETLDHLLASDLPALRILALDMEEGGQEADRTLPDPFLALGHLPALRQLEINRLTPDAAARLDRLKAARGLA